MVSSNKRIPEPLGWVECLSMGSGQDHVCFYISASWIWSLSLTSANRLPERRVFPIQRQTRGPPQIARLGSLMGLNSLAKKPGRTVVFPASRAPTRGDRIPVTNNTQCCDSINAEMIEWIYPFL